MFIIHSTMSKTMEGGRVSTWRFVQTDEGFCAIGGNYKLLQYRTESAMRKSIEWYASKGYKPVAAAA